MTAAVKPAMRDRRLDGLAAGRLAARGRALAADGR